MKPRKQKDSLSESLYTESYVESEIEKKSRRTKSSKRHLNKKKLPLKKDSDELSSKQSVSHIERK